MIATEALGREPLPRSTPALTPVIGAEHALFRTVLLPLLADVAERAAGSTGTTRPSTVPMRRLERSLFGEGAATRRSRRSWGSRPVAVELGDGVRVRHTADGELTAHWAGRGPARTREFGRETDRLCVLELERPLPAAGG